MFVHFNCFLLPSPLPHTPAHTSAGSTWASLHKIKLQRRARREEVCNVKTKVESERAQVTRRWNSKKIVLKCLLARIKAAATVTFYLKLNSARSVSMKNFSFSRFCFAARTNATQMKQDQFWSAMLLLQRTLAGRLGGMEFEKMYAIFNSTTQWQALRFNFLLWSMIIQYTAAATKRVAILVVRQSVGVGLLSFAVVFHQSRRIY